MRRRAALFTGLLALLGLACTPPTPTWSQQKTTNHPRKHVMVQFTASYLHPSEAQLVPGGTVSWVNYGSLYEGSVVFKTAAANAVSCKEMEGQWMKTAVGIQSIPITMGGASDDLQLPCPLPSGEYDYEIWLYSGGVAPDDMDDPQSQLPGRIVVK